VKLGDCLKVINRRIWDHERHIAQRRAKGLQVSPLLHRIRELESIRREIAALSTPKLEGDLRVESQSPGARASAE
jgi:hypothetical protein